MQLLQLGWSIGRKFRHLAVGYSWVEYHVRSGRIRVSKRQRAIGSLLLMNNSTNFVLCDAWRLVCFVEASISSVVNFGQKDCDGWTKLVERGGTLKSRFARKNGRRGCGWRK